MRSSKSRNRNKNNNRRPSGNIINRVFDSSGPEGKVRGTPQQIIDKYNQLARDATLAGDRVAVENFQQHAEHYTRLLAEAQREQAERQAQQEAQQAQEAAQKAADRAVEQAEATRLRLEEEERARPRRPSRRVGDRCARARRLHNQHGRYGAGLVEQPLPRARAPCAHQ